MEMPLLESKEVKHRRLYQWLNWGILDKGFAKEPMCDIDKEEFSIIWNPGVDVEKVLNADEYAHLFFKNVNHYFKDTERVIDIDYYKDKMKILLEEQSRLEASKQKTLRKVISPRDRYWILKQQGYKCNWCGVSLKYKKTSELGDELAHIDHIHPFSKRDTYIHGEDKINERENLQALCSSCNLKKKTKTD